MSHIYKSAILGGTFDHFHIGHEQFIETALQKSEHITIGIVRNILSNDKFFQNSIEDYTIRLESLTNFLDKLKVKNRTTIISINDIYGSSLTDSTIEAIFVTDSTRPNADKINIERQQIGMSQLAIEIVPYTFGDDGKIISSGRIRAGGIDRKGSSYLKFFLQKKIYILPNHLRESLQNPLGTIISNPEDITQIIPPHNIAISIGDIVSIDLKKANYPTAISIIDYKTRRENIDKKEIEKYFPVINKQLNNSAGTINSESVNIILSSLADYQNAKATQVIAVSGEEDLLALPAILLSPLSTFVIYGQYEVGMIVVEVTEDTKAIVKNYLSQFN